MKHGVVGGAYVGSLTGKWHFHSSQKRCQTIL